MVIIPQEIREAIERLASASEDYAYATRRKEVARVRQQESREQLNTAILRELPHPKPIPPHAFKIAFSGTECAVCGIETEQHNVMTASTERDPGDKP